jgi:hypothetical protein
VNPDETPQTTEPETVKLSLSQFVHQVADLVTDVHSRHRIPHGTAFQVVAFGMTQFEARADAAARSAAIAAATQEAPTE